ncbi:MAG: hypothetical protein ACRDNS_10040 [Trebonia sp.]
MIPSIGRIVRYRLGEQSAVEIERRRADARASAISSQHTGAIVHVGNPVRAGDVYPMMITRVWDEDPTEDTCVQGQVFLDGNDVLWVTSVRQGDAEYQWSEPVRTAAR